MTKTEDERLDALTEPRRDARYRLPAAPASLGGMSAADLDWVENWLIQKRGTEHAARPYGKGSLLLTTLIFEVRRERQKRKDHPPSNPYGIRTVYLRDGDGMPRDIDTSGLRLGEYRTTYTAPSEAEQIKRGTRTGVIVGLGLPILIIAAVVAGLMWWHTGGVLPQ
jgi:hypothetical protein